MMITTKLQMDLANHAAPGRICAKQGDTNTRQVTLSLLENGVPWTIPETAVPVIRYQCLPGGGGGVYDTLADGSAAWHMAGNEITVTLAPQMLAEAGTALMDIALTDSGNLLATYNIHIHVEGSPQEGAALHQTDYFNLSSITAAYDSLRQVADQSSAAIAATAEAALVTIPLAVADWLDTHPEATTSVADGSISVRKTNFIHYTAVQLPSLTVPRFTNQIPISTDAGGNLLGIVKNTRLGLSSGLTEPMAGFDTTGFIPLTGAGDVLRLQNLAFSGSDSCRLAFYRPDKVLIGVISGADIPGDAAFADRFVLDDSGFFTSIDLTARESAYTSGLSVAVGYLRFTAQAMEADAIATVNEKIAYVTAPGAVELTDLTLDEGIAVPQAAHNAAAIAALAQRVAALEKLAET